MPRESFPAVRMRVRGHSKPEDQIKPLTVKIKRAAKLLDVSDHSVRRYVDKGILEADHVGGFVLIKYSSIEKLLGLNDEAAR